GQSELIRAVAASEHLSPAAAVRFLERQESLNRAAERIDRLLGDAGSGGSWIDHGTQRLVVNATLEGATAAVSRDGGTPRLVERSLRDLGHLKAAIEVQASRGGIGGVTS